MHDHRESHRSWPSEDFLNCGEILESDFDFLSDKLEFAPELAAPFWKCDA